MDKIDWRKMEEIRQRENPKFNIVDGMLHSLSMFIIMYRDNLKKSITEPQKQELRYILMMYEELLKEE